MSEGHRDTRRRDEGRRDEGRRDTRRRDTRRRDPRRRDENDNSVYIGKRPTMNYVMAAMVILNKGVDCTIKARGRAISHAVDVAEILLNKFYPSAYYKDIKITTEHLENDDHRVSNVSSMEIVLGPQKPKEPEPELTEEPEPVLEPQQD